tara:strand:+ start:429 stop:863 length:435 start_codon:yes stop_codon:yes gene_type:complete
MSLFDNEEKREGKRLIVIITVTVVFLGLLGFVLNAVGTFGNTAVKELGGDALLRKYEWFKDAHNQLNAKTANIKIYKAKLDAFKQLENPDRTDKENFATWAQELAGMQASYNDLAAEYNSNMSKVNWKFCSGDNALPREYKTDE